MWYTVRCYVTHGEYGPGPYFEIPINVRIERLAHKQQKVDSHVDWNSVPVKFDANLKC